MKYIKITLRVVILIFASLGILVLINPSFEKFVGVTAYWFFMASIWQFTGHIGITAEQQQELFAKEESASARRMKNKAIKPALASAILLLFVYLYEGWQ